jgi:glycosyltransferase involved in cell wall biosynthesis
MKIAYAVTVPASAKSFLAGQIRHLVESGHDVRLFARDEPLLQDVARDEGASAVGLPFEREISPRADLIALLATWRSFRAFRPDVASVGTPKAGLVGGLAAVFAGVPVRVYVLHGIRGEKAGGFKGRLLRLIERIACACAHKIVCVSPSVRDRGVELGFLSKRKAVVFGPGSANGVDMARFSEPPDAARLDGLRQQLGLARGVKVIGFVGRFVRDKGVNELISAFAAIEHERPEARLVMLGGFEDADPVGAATRARIEQGGSIVWPGAVSDTADYYHLIDLLVLPTYREGFPTVCLEAAAAGVPVIATTATGARDAVIHGVTGLLVEPGDAGGLATAMAELLDDPERAKAMGRAGQDRVRTQFQPQRIWQSLEKLYLDLLAEKRGGRQ